MSRFSGRQGRGSIRDLRATKKAEAEERNAITPADRRRATREMAAGRVLRDGRWTP